MSHEFITPEHGVYALLREIEFCKSLEEIGADPSEMHRLVVEYLEGMEMLPESEEHEPSFSSQYYKAVSMALDMVRSSEGTQLQLAHLVKGFMMLEDSYAANLLREFIGEDRFASFMTSLIIWQERAEEAGRSAGQSETSDGSDGADDEENGEDDDDMFPSVFPGDDEWRQYVGCLNSMVLLRKPLVGREAELERTIQVLCRKEKGNVLHIGEHGVGKTALVCELARLINEGKVPVRLRECRIYQLNLGTLVAGAQYRGEFEKRLKMVMDGLEAEGDAIVYIDEIHNIVGAGSTSEGSLDGANLLKPYMEEGLIRFIGSTTYDDYNRYFSKSKSLIRSFQQIDVAEPSIEETVAILKRLKKSYESYHGVKYADKAIEFAVTASAKHINDRFLPDKAIDLIDEAGAYRSIHPVIGKKTQTVDKQLVSEMLSKICKVDALAMKEDDNKKLETLGKRITAQIYGQDQAVRQLVEAVQMAKAGLTDDNKPLASLLFVGPTGVGKTEVARVLAQEMGIGLVRFDMSEYTEKHTVAKLIGSPAGYVGYEDGGLLTDAIRKTPNCVLLLDEIEKAHEDIYNILLQVMDYARLTDNKGRKADFRNVVLVMTSNAGAQYAAQANIGFSGHVSAGEAMMKQVKKTFKPEFINRLSGTVMFNDMDRAMASLILDKKLRQLQDKLSARKVEMALADEARSYLLEKGFTREYGAREIDRVIANELKPLLMREILFGKLKKGGKAKIDILSSQMVLV